MHAGIVPVVAERQGAADGRSAERGSGGRAAQRRRTRRAIVDAAARLVAEGRDPSIAEIAAAADVSRRTVYEYFPTLDQLLIDATLGVMAGAEFSAALDFDRFGDDVHARLDALARTLSDMSDRALPLGRRLLRLTVDTPASDDDAAAPRRGYRRIQWIEHAVQPLRDRLTAEQFERLVSALAVALGWEAMIVLRDTRNLTRATERRVTGWAVHALVDAMLSEAEAGAPPDQEPS
jgi:AcrR family transcriptional regulator